MRGPFDYRLAEGQDTVEVGSVLGPAVRRPRDDRCRSMELAEESAVDGDRLVEQQAVLPDAWRRTWCGRRRGWRREH